MYATGSCATHKDLMDAVSTFAVANAGFTETVRRSVVLNDFLSGFVPVSYTVLCLSKGVDHFWFASAAGLTTFRGYHARNNDGSGYGDASDRCPWEFSAGIVLAPFLSYHLFTEGNAIHVAGQGSSGGFVHFNFGNLIKYGTFDGGAYMLGMRNNTASLQTVTDPNLNAPNFYLTGGPNSYGDFNSPISLVRVALGTNKYAKSWVSSPGNSPSGVSVFYITGITVELARSILRDTPSEFNGRASGIRFECFVDDAVSMGGTTDLWRPLGYVPNIRAINITNLNPLDIVNTDWMVFPLNAKVGVVGAQTNTYGWGWAVRK